MSAKNSFKPVLIVLAVLAVAYALFLRIRRERLNNVVEICVSWSGTEDLVKEEVALHPLQETVSLEGFLERLRTVGAASLAIRGESLLEAVASGRALFFPPEEIEKFRSLGLATEGMLASNQIWIRKNPDLASRIQQALGQLGFSEKIRIKKIGDYTLIENPAGSWAPFLNLDLGCGPEKLALAARENFSLVSLMDDSGKGGPPGAIRPLQGPSHSAWLVFGPVPNDKWGDFFRSEAFVKALQDDPARFAALEYQPFSYGKLFSEITGEPDRAVRAHTVSPEEMRGLSYPALESRWIRAVQERSCRFLYFQWNPDWDLEKNFSLLRDVAEDLKSRGYVLSALPARGPAPRNFLNGNFFRKFRLLLALVAAIAAPLWALQILGAFPGGSPADLRAVYALWGKTIAATVLGGLLIGALLPDPELVSGLEIFRGVKLAILIPFLAAGWVFYGPEGLARIGRMRISVLGALAGAFAAAALLIMVLRSGNSAAAPHPLELHLRSILENLLCVRPRFKEFLIGHPLMILGIYLAMRDALPGPQSSRPLRFNASVSQGKAHLPFIFLWAGFLGTVSVVNSFCHLHTPVTVTLLRTFHGAWMGALLGLLAIGLFRWFEAD